MVQGKFQQTSRHATLHRQKTAASIAQPLACSGCEALINTCQKNEGNAAWLLTA